MIYETLMKTPKIHEISNIGNRNCTHLGLKSIMLQPILIYFSEHIKCHIRTTLKLGVNIDDLQLVHINILFYMSMDT